MLMLSWHVQVEEQGDAFVCDRRWWTRRSNTRESTSRRRHHFHRGRGNWSTERTWRTVHPHNARYATVHFLDSSLTNRFTDNRFNGRIFRWQDSSLTRWQDHSSVDNDKFIHLSAKCLVSESSRQRSDLSLNWSVSEMSLSTNWLSAKWWQCGSCTIRRWSYS